MKDRYNLNLLPTEGEEEETEDAIAKPVVLPGMGIDEEQIQQIRKGKSLSSLTMLTRPTNGCEVIIGLNRGDGCLGAGR